jgi:hypothetical protein
MSFCARGKFWEKEPHTHSPPPLSVVGVSNTGMVEITKFSADTNSALFFVDRDGVGDP